MEPTSVVDVHELLRRRRSGRSYDATRELTEDDIGALLEAARWAPSGGNAQPWRYLVGRKGSSTYDRLLALLADGNKKWAQHAPVLILTVYQAIRTTPDGQKVDNRTAQHDLGMANLSLVLEAVSRGLMARMMGGFNRDAALTLIDAEEHGYDVGPVMALGYERDPSHLSDDIQEREKQPRTRKPASEMLLTLQ